MANRLGTTEKVSISLPSDVIGGVRARAGNRGVSAYVTEAVRHQLAMDNLGELVTDIEEHTGGPLTEEEIEAARAELLHEPSSGVQPSAA